MRLEEVSRNYDRAAGKYEERLEFWFGRVLNIEQFRNRAVDLLGCLQGAVVLDIGCGAGADLPLLAPLVGPAGKIIALDYSEKMLSRAGELCWRRGWTNVELVRGDAVELAEVEGPVDAILSTYCFGLLYDIQKALENAVEKLRPGGSMAILDFARAKPEHRALRTLHPLYRRAFRRTGLSSLEDLDDEALRRRWELARAFFKDRFDNCVEKSFLFDMGVLLAGDKPAEGRKQSVK